MPVAYLQNGKAFLRNGVPVLGDCCCPFTEAAVDFWYDLAGTVPQKLHGATGYHTITVQTRDAAPSVTVPSQSALWDAANWPTDANWTTLECANNTCNYAKRNGQARISMRLAYGGRQIGLSFNDSRTFTSPTWSATLRAHLKISGLKGTHQIRLYDSNGTFIGNRGNGTFPLDTFPKTNTTTVSGIWRIDLA